MYPESIYAELRQRAERGLSLLRELLPAMAPVSKYAGWTSEELETLSYLLTATARTSESVMLLVAYLQLWDSEILVRSVTEGTLKFCYLLQDPMTFKARHLEYSEDLFQIAIFKDHKKASELLNGLPNPDASDWKPIRDRVLSAEQLANLAAKYPAPMRHSLESRWGFTGLANHLARTGDAAFNGFRSFAHGYSNASHIYHVDYIGASLPTDRDRRSPERRDLATLTHGYRLVSEVVALLQVRLQVGYRYVSGDPNALAEIIQKIESFAKDGEPIYEKWMKLEYPAEFERIDQSVL